MSRPWPLLIVTKSGVMHISDAQNVEDDSNYDCRCGKAMGSRNDHHALTSRNFYTNDEDPCDAFASGDYKYNRAGFFNGGLKLCSGCGTPEDFDAAVDKYRKERAKFQEDQDEDSRRRRDIRGVLKAELSQIFDHLVKYELEEFACANQDVFVGSDFNWRTEQ